MGLSVVCGFLAGNKLAGRELLLCGKECKRPRES